MKSPLLNAFMEDKSGDDLIMKQISWIIYDVNKIICWVYKDTLVLKSNDTFHSSLAPQLDN